MSKFQELIHATEGGVYIVHATCQMTPRLIDKNSYKYDTYNLMYVGMMV